MVSASSDKDALDMSSCRVPFVTAEVKLLGLYAIARANDLREHCWGHLSCYEEFLKTRKTYHLPSQDRFNSNAVDNVLTTTVFVIKVHIQSAYLLLWNVSFS